MARPNRVLKLESYDPNPLLDRLISVVPGQNDIGLAAALGVTKSIISKIRNKHADISAEMLLNMHEMSGLSIRELRNLMGDTRRLF
ncbi:helix-turn-helix domain-containing protein [Noviherbaspirillum malthae]|jgi:plasmid maintenance system antidote protein VapI|uniref:helix-turn-helix domain-containing protein n=1 Tax=Noviherbaspirillum malthae TaxID=1260987 RepID=UPI0018904295|nr:helix-turn-helix domain-containing protein [Noviherbaspirillum malthae]